ncbi:hypothetical protein T08_3320 [Trichinella sp. T8]|nr:hypothetical protein T08_3320 [Trichinella sp. T8]
MLKISTFTWKQYEISVFAKLNFIFAIERMITFVAETIDDKSMTSHFEELYSILANLRNNNNDRLYFFFKYYLSIDK